MHAHSASCCTAGTGTGAFFKTMEHVGLGDYFEQTWMARGMKAVARLILTTIASPIFIILAMVYNGTVSIAKLSMGIVYLVRGGGSAALCFDETMHHLVFGVYDFAIQFFFPVMVISFTLFPKLTSSLHGHITSFIDEIQPFTTCA